jgi:hypothetical protein
MMLGAAALAQPAKPAVEMAAHTVMPRDTLIGVRDRMLRPGTDWRVLQRLNRVADPRRLKPGSTLLIPADLLREQPAVAEVVHINGDVRVQHLNAPGAAEALGSGMVLNAGDIVIAARQSSAVLRFADGARVLVRPDSELRLERLTKSGSTAQTQLELRQGSVDSSVPPTNARPADAAARRYQIRTPVANLGVRGTEFRTRLDGERTHVEVLEGRVATAAAGAGLLVDGGFGAVLAPGSAAAVPRLLPLLGAPDLSNAARRVERLPLQLGWAALDGAVAYRAQVTQPDESQRLVLDGRFAQAAARFADDLPDGRYALRVRAVDGNGLEGRDAKIDFTLKARPEPPFIERPRSGMNAYDEAVDFAWTRHAGAARYRLQIADNPGFDPSLVDRADIADTQARILLPLGHYSWRLASIRADGDQGPFGDTQTLLRRAPPASPPAADPLLDEKGLRLRWQAANEPGASYAYQFARDNAFTQIVKEGRTAEEGVLLGQAASGSYFLRVRSIASDGFEGPWGAPQQIEVPSDKRWWWLLLPAALLLL